MKKNKNKRCNNKKKNCKKSKKNNLFGFIKIKKTQKDKSFRVKGSQYIPRKDLTDPVEYASHYAARYDRGIISEVADFRVKEEALMKQLQSRGDWDYKRYY